MENKKPIKKNHIKEFGGRNAPEASQGQIRDVPRTPGTFGPIFVEIPIQGAECPRDRWDISTGQMGHFHVCHTGVSRQNSLCLLFFFFPQRNLAFLGGCSLRFTKKSKERKDKGCLSFFRSAGKGVV